MKRIAVEGRQGRPHGRVESQQGRVTGLKVVRGRGKTKADAFEFRDAAGRLEITFDADGLGLTGAKVRGRDCLVADGHGMGRMFTPEQRAESDRRVSLEHG